jgi:arabinan endo-1,5-alpha-L-arabinosidase
MNTNHPHVPCASPTTSPAKRLAKRNRLRAGLAAGLAALLSLCAHQAPALQGATGIHDPSSIIKYNGVYHTWATGNQIYHLTSTDMVKWNVGSTVFASGTWPSWINTYVSGFGGFFWAPECYYMNGKYYMYYSCSMGAKPCAIGVATSSNLSSWSDQGVVVYSTTSTTYGSIDPAIFADASGNRWMAFGSHLNGIWLAQLNTSTGKRLNSTLYNVAGNGGSSEHEGALVIRHGSYYYMFFNRGVCCNGTGSTYYISVGRSTSPTGPYTDKSGRSLMSNGGTTFLSSSGRYIGPGHLGYFSESGIEFISYHFYDGNANGAPTLRASRVLWDSSGWPYASADWIANGTYKIVNKGNGLAWDDWGCTGASLQAICQNTYSGLTCQKWTFATLGNGLYRINCAQGGLSAEALNCSASNGAKLDIYSYWGGSCQQWNIERASDGSYVLASGNGNRVVDVPNASTTTGTQLQIWDYLGNNAQKWLIQSP